MKMYGQVMSASERLEAMSNDIVFILGHMQENSASLHKAWIQFMPHHFFTPTYIFLDSEGNPQFEDVSKKYMHRMISEDKLVSILETLLHDQGKGLSHSVWIKTRDRFNEAEKSVADGQWIKGLEILEAIEKEKSSPVLVQRAERRRKEIRDMMFLKSEAMRLEESGRSNNDAPGATYGKAIDEAMLGNFITASALCRSFLDKTRDDLETSSITELHTRLKAHIEDAIIAGPIKPTKIPISGMDEPFWEIVITFGTKLPIINKLVVQYWALTDRGNVFAGYQTLENIEPYFRHLTSAYLPFSELEREVSTSDRASYEKLKDIRYEIYAGQKLMAFKNLQEDPESEWWSQTKVRSLKFLKKPGWGWDSLTRMTKSDKGLIYKRPEILSIEPRPPRKKVTESRD